jgi:hypothetical protein
MNCAAGIPSGRASKRGLRMSTCSNSWRKQEGLRLAPGAVAYLEITDRTVQRAPAVSRLCANWTFPLPSLSSMYV